jgi:uncharacterized protein (DUF305 family)
MNRNMLSLALLAAALSISTLPAVAPAEDNADAIKKSLMDADHTMMMNMDSAPMTGDADKDFVAMMIPHHRGAIDMAKVELQYGKDPQLRAMAEAIIKAQEEEIAEMKKWQAAHP